MSCDCEQTVKELMERVRVLENRTDMREERWVSLPEMVQRSGYSRGWFYNGHAKRAGLDYHSDKRGIRCLESEFVRWLREFDEKGGGAAMQPGQ
jgi:hypothetical protein